MALPSAFHMQEVPDDEGDTVGVLRELNRMNTKPLEPLHGAKRLESLASSRGFSHVPSLTPSLAAAIARTHKQEGPEEVVEFAHLQIRPTAISLLGSFADDGVPAMQLDENDEAQLIMVAEPDAAMVGSLHPRGSLYERPVNTCVSKAQHAKLREVNG